ncbi:MAG: hypothetical protein A3J45_06685 [Candidatus Rokubacteria bacterium RIFCSPHIGHO2_02_FULL_69_13]|nr:MAG: hypothetical protein A3J45_06685 [Candidatus Rokubacteria bacterium RIFCSPHIGHO2_02_FULL_69_13]
MPVVGTMSVTTGRPTVRVPVLSSTTVRALCSSSSAPALLMRTPCSAPLPVPTMIAVGVASPMAHGQAITRTATKLVSAKRNAGCGPQSHQTAKVTAAMTSTIGTKTAETRSASRWIGAFEPCASSTRRMIRARTVSLPTRVARKVKLPVRFTVPPMTRDPRRFSTGRLSPVSMDSSTAEAPSVTSPSTAIRSPGRTRMRSPITTSATGTSSSALPRITRAVLGASAISRRIASDVRPRARASSQRPTTISVISTPAVS